MHIKYIESIHIKYNIANKYRTSTNNNNNNNNKRKNPYLSRESTNMGFFDLINLGK